MTRRQLLLSMLPASLVPGAMTSRIAAPQRPNMARLDQLTRQLVRLQEVQEGWPDRAQEASPAETLEELAAKIAGLEPEVKLNTGVQKILAAFVGEHDKWIRWCVWMIGGQTFPPAKGEL